MHPRNFASHESVRPSVRTKGKQLMWNDLFYFVWRLQPAFNLMANVLAMVILATWTFREKKRQQSQVWSFDYILMSTLTWIIEKELA